MRTHLSHAICEAQGPSRASTKSGLTHAHAMREPLAHDLVRGLGLQEATLSIGQVLHERESVC